MPLTDTACKNARPREKSYKKADGGGLYLEVMPNGSRYWRLKYRFCGKEKRLACGVYPDTTLIAAREKRGVARTMLAGGIDPSSAKRDKRLLDETNVANTFEAVAREWHEQNRVKWTPIYAEDILHRLETDIFPSLGKRPVAATTALDVLNTLRRIENRGAGEMARRAGQYCGQILRYAVVTGRAERDPTADLKGALKPVRHGHFAALEPKDLPEFLNALERNDARLYILTRLAMRLMLLSFVRTSELINATWGEFDLDGAEWCIPAERMKMRRAHVVPLSKQAVVVLRELHTMNGDYEWVFASATKPRRHMSNNTTLKALERLGYAGRMTGHGFRALAMTTIMEKLNIRHEVIDLQLAHSKGDKVRAAYDRTKFIDERRKMMQDWADYLDNIASGGKVIVGKFGKTA